VGASVFMNVIATAPGWRSRAVWAMPPVAYALASDALIGVVRSWAIARPKHPNITLAVEEVTPIAAGEGPARRHEVRQIPGPGHPAPRRA
jgi:hypothetical protein